jgi:hypothetical protein
VARERTPAPRKIVCVTTDDHSHQHIVSVGVNGDPEAPFDKLTVDEVRAAILAGQGFVTHGPGTERPRIVRSASCRIEGCHVKTIESVPEIDVENSLYDLDACP